MLAKTLLGAVTRAVVPVVALTMAATAALAADFPSKPINLMVGFTPGGSTDAVARVLARALGDSLGQPVVVQNKAGGGGTVCVSTVAKADPDGHTLCMSVSSAVSSSPHELKLDYDIGDVQPVARVGDYALAAVVKSGTPIKDWKGLMAHGKSKGELAYGSNTTVERVVAGEIARKEGIKIKALPYKSGGEIMKDVIGDHIDYGSSGGGYIPFADAGQVTVVAAMTSKRLSAYPDVPTLLELGYDHAINIYIGVFAPKGLNANARKKLDDAFAKAVRDPEYVDLLTKKVRLDLNYMGSDEFTAFLRKDYEAMGTLIKSIKSGS